MAMAQAILEENSRMARKADAACCEGGKRSAREGNEGKILTLGVISQSRFQFRRFDGKENRWENVGIETENALFVDSSDAFKRAFVENFVAISAEGDKTIPHQQMDITVIRIRVLNKHCYLIMVEHEDDRKWILNATPLYLGPHMVFALPWDTTFDLSNLETARVPVWVELPNIHPSMEAFGPQLLQSIGEVLFASCEESDCHYTSIKGCLRMDLSTELPEAIEVFNPDTNESYLQQVVYKSLPNACISCHQRGHLARNCPNKKQIKQQP
ncbi:hypothetical protein R1sor_012139 [Riccia sorocarpa]|uniref:CCHC-type domain-containing protein n=1 Tax=Riccia sorocarpa TaxID=122646 RepID=A0ABD3I3A1_9MARC